MGELISHAARGYKTKAGEERSSYEVKVLVGADVKTVQYKTEQDAKLVIGNGEPRKLVSLRVLVLLKTGRTGPWMSYIGLAPRPAAA